MGEEDWNKGIQMLSLEWSIKIPLVEKPSSVENLLKPR